MNWQIAIDVGTCYIKVIEGDKRNNRLVLRRIGYFPSPLPDFKENLIEREQDIFVKTLKEFLQKYRITSKRGILGIGGTGTVIHYFDIPDIPKGEIDSAINLEIMQVVPGGTKNLEYDYIILPNKNNKNKKTILFVGYHREKCEFLLSTIQRSGIKPLIMDYNGIAVLNGFKFLHKKQEGTISILNIGYKTSNFVIAEQDGFILVRDIPFGSKNIIDTVARSKNISNEEAEIFEKKKENREEIKKIIASDISDLLSEVKTSIEYFKTRTGISIQTLFLTGGGSLFPGICETFEKEIDTKTTRWNPLEELDTKEILLPVDLKNKGPIFAVSIGLAVRDLK